MAKISDVAKEAGVSPATVSRTFNESGLLNKDTQSRVLEAARRLNYNPPRLRKQMAITNQASNYDAIHSAVSRTVGFQFFSTGPADTLTNNTFYAEVLEGARAEAATLGLEMVINTTDRHQAAHAIPQLAREQDLAGLLLVGVVEPQIQAAFSHYFREIILVDNRDDMGITEGIITDGVGGAYAAASYLIGLGHRRIAFLTAEAEVKTFQDRQRGYASALFEAGIAPERDLVFPVPFTLSHLERKAKIAQFLQGPNRPTAIVAANDFLAHITLKVCDELGLRVPDDISVVGFDDIASSHKSSPPLTTVRVETEQMGRLAVRRLFARLNDNTGNTGKGSDTGGTSIERRVCTLVPVSLVVRQSCRSLC
ncbi:MAG: LacI family DNA-binding transcriptional regulator [Armatimonadota bacterium]